jgi:hypothetical protein
MCWKLAALVSSLKGMGNEEGMLPNQLSSAKLFQLPSTE